MKKIIIISIIFSIMLGLGIWEMTYTTRLFTNLKANLELVETSIYSSGENIDNAETLSLMDDVNIEWKKGRELIFCMANHNVLRTLDEKIVSLDAMIKINYVDDAKIAVTATKNLVECVRNDTYFVWTNLF